MPFIVHNSDASGVLGLADRSSMKERTAEII